MRRSARTSPAWLRRFPPLGPYAEALGLGVVVLGIAFFSLVLGELVPKRLALGHPERLAALAAVPLRLLSRAAVPAVRVLGGATEAVLWLLGARGLRPPPVTDEDITGLMSEGRGPGCSRRRSTTWSGGSCGSGTGVPGP